MKAFLNLWILGMQENECKTEYKGPSLKETNNSLKLLPILHYWGKPAYTVLISEIQSKYKLPDMYWNLQRATIYTC